MYLRISASLETQPEPAPTPTAQKLRASAQAHTTAACSAPGAGARVEPKSRLGKDCEDTELERDVESRAITCPQRHVLKVMPAVVRKSGPYCCDACGARIDDKAAMFSCRRCNYDLCSVCHDMNRVQRTDTLADAAAFAAFNVVMSGDRNESKPIRWPLWTRFERNIGWESFSKLVVGTYRLPTLVLELGTCRLHYVHDDGELRNLNNCANLRTLLDMVAQRDEVQSISEPVVITIELQRKQKCKPTISRSCNLNGNLASRQQQLRKKLSRRLKDTPKIRQSPLHSWSRLKPNTRAWCQWTETLSSLLNAAPKLVEQACIEHVTPPRCWQNGKRAYLLVAVQMFRIHSFIAFGRRFMCFTNPGYSSKKMHAILGNVLHGTHALTDKEIPRLAPAVVSADVTLLLATQDLANLYAGRDLFQLEQDAVQEALATAAVPDSPGKPSQWIPMCSLQIEQFDSEEHRQEEFSKTLVDIGNEDEPCNEKVKGKGSSSSRSKGKRGRKKKHPKADSSGTAVNLSVRQHLSTATSEASCDPLLSFEGRVEDAEVWITNRSTDFSPTSEFTASDDDQTWTIVRTKSTAHRNKHDERKHACKQAMATTEGCTQSSMLSTSVGMTKRSVLDSAMSHNGKVCTVATASEVAVEEGGCTLQRNIMTMPHDAKRDIAWCASSDIYDGYEYQNDIDALLG